MPWLMNFDLVNVEERYPKPKEIEEYAARVRLTYKQVRGWFVERRRKEKRDTGGCEGTSAYYADKFREICRSGEKRRKSCNYQSDSALTSVEKRFRAQDTLWSSDYIIRKILRKDGPPLGAEFDCIPDKSSSKSPGNQISMLLSCILLVSQLTSSFSSKIISLVK